MIGGYRSALKLRQGQVVFDEEQFLKSRPHLEEFLGQLLHFQHFRQFINGRIEKLKNRMQDKDLFDIMRSCSMKVSHGVLEQWGV